MARIEGRGIIVGSAGGRASKVRLVWHRHRHMGRSAWRRPVELLVEKALGPRLAFFPARHGECADFLGVSAKRKRKVQVECRRFCVVWIAAAVCWPSDGGGGGGVGRQPAEIPLEWSTGARGSCEGENGQRRWRRKTGRSGNKYPSPSVTSVSHHVLPMTLPCPFFL